MYLILKQDKSSIVPVNNVDEIKHVLVNNVSNIAITKADKRILLGIYSSESEAKGVLKQMLDWFTSQEAYGKGYQMPSSETFTKGFTLK